ncbi:MAG: ester cyclase [Pseudomonadota bacterium]
MTNPISLAALATLLAASVAQADDLQVVKTFYADHLTTPTDLTRQHLDEVLAEKFVLAPTPPLGSDAQGMFDIVKFGGRVVPDLAWQPHEILQHGNRYTVRSIATGAHTADFMSVNPATGISFDIMLIDSLTCLTVENGKITQSFLVENWATAIAKLTEE